VTIRNAASMGTYGATWTSRGYAGTGNVAHLIGTLEGRVAIVAGSARGVFAEVEDVKRQLVEAPVVFAVNEVGIYMSDAEHWISLHADNLGVWRAARWLHPRPTDPQIHSVDMRPHIQHIWSNLTPCFALSGYFAMQIAYIMGASQIILCGCPGMPWPRFFEACPRPDFGYGLGTNGNDEGTRQQLEHEMKRLPDFKAVVRSTRGWTHNFFGGPEQWQHSQR